MSTLKEKIEVMQAALDGKEIEISHIHALAEWRTVDARYVDWDWIHHRYRIKREPRVIYVYPGDISVQMGMGPDRNLSNTIKFVEVLE